MNHPPANTPPDFESPVRRFFTRLRRVLFHAAAGTLSIEELRQHIGFSWRPTDAHKLESMTGLTDCERSLCERLVGRQWRALVAGAGTGRELVALGELGGSIVGVDPVRESVDFAKGILAERRMSATVIEGFIEDIELPGLFDVVMFSCYRLIPERRRRVDALRKVGAHLATDGRILIAYPLREQVRSLIGLAAATTLLTRSRWHPEAGDHLYGTARPSQEGLAFEHFFRPGEIESEATAAGLQVVFSQAPTHDAAAVIVLRRAPDNEVSG